MRPEMNRTDSTAPTSTTTKNQSVSAEGTVVIDLQGFGNGSGAASQQNAIHVKPADCLEPEATADAGQHTEFAFPKAAGSSTGAHYNSKTGLMVLDSQVEMTTNTNGSPPSFTPPTRRWCRNSKEACLYNPVTGYSVGKRLLQSAIVSFAGGGFGTSMGPGHRA